MLLLCSMWPRLLRVFITLLSDFPSFSFSSSSSSFRHSLTTLHSWYYKSHQLQITSIANHTNYSACGRRAGVRFIRHVALPRLHSRPAARGGHAVCLRRGERRVSVRVFGAVHSNYNKVLQFSRAHSLIVHSHSHSITLTHTYSHLITPTHTYSH